MSPTATLPTIREPLDPEWVERSAVERGEPDLLRRSRRSAAERAAAVPWPTGQEEEWRRFPPAQIPPTPLTGATATASYIAAGLPKGVYIADLATAVRERPDLVERWLDTGGRVPTHSAMTALADALWTTGTFVYVPRGVTLRAPMTVERTWSGDGAALSRTIVVAEEDSRFTFVEDVRSAGGAAAHVAIPHLDVHVGAGADVRYVHLQRYASDVWDLGAQWYGSDRDSRLASYNVLLGSTRTKLGIVSDMKGNGAEVKLYGLIAAGEDQRIDVDSLQRLDGRGGQSDLLYLSALYDSAKATFYGVVRVEPTSHATGSYQECRNLLLSDKAGANPIPVLEILTNDVSRCGHGATAGRMSEEELFYVLSRGVDRKTAEALLVRGSFARVIDRIPDEAVCARVLEALRPRIGHIAEIDMDEAA
ncbi:MAG: SufD family Fe-S cluster assembly protein [Chloroflexi bacterium]|nr:SufD family Fe-S cluster assembly protein [Chloroflexota bacterium]